ncbi:putative bacilysin exporter BacE [bacterium BMS3Abin06]|nr:putative bacilysin exporter BacE [bacterium BMS3Abin06]
MKSFQAFSSLRHRNFRLFWIGQFITLTGSWMHQTAQGWLVYELTGSPFFLGLAGTAASAPILLFTLAGGVLADRYPKRKIMLAAYIILMALTLTLTVLVATSVVNIRYVLILAFLIGSVLAFEIPARQSFIIELVGKEDLLNGIALNSTAFHGARMMGPAIAGFLMASTGLASCFFINTLSFLAIIAALIKIRFRSGDMQATSGPGIKKSFREGLKYIRHNPTVYILLISVGIISFFGFPYISFLPVYARDILKTGETGLGILMGCAGAGAFTGAIGLAARGDTPKKGFVMAAAAIIFSLALLIFSISETIRLSYAMLFFVGFGAINMIATANSLLQLSVPDELRGRVMSSFTTMFLGMAPIGNFAVGSLAHYTGTQNALLTSAGLCLSGTMLILWKKPEIFKL